MTLRPLAHSVPSEPRVVRIRSDSPMQPHSLYWHWGDTHFVICNSVVDDSSWYVLPSKDTVPNHAWINLHWNPNDPLLIGGRRIDSRGNPVDM